MQFDIEENKIIIETIIVNITKLYFKKYYISNECLSDWFANNGSRMLPSVILDLCFGNWLFVFWLE